MNETMRVLTFVTVLLGTLALVAGIMGMNFELAFFHSGQTGFLLVTGAMIVATAASPSSARVGIDAPMKIWLTRQP